MSTKVKAYAAYQTKEKLQPFSFNRREIREHDVLIKILYCGICRTTVSNQLRGLMKEYGVFVAAGYQKLKQELLGIFDRNIENGRHFSAYLRLVPR